MSRIIIAGAGIGGLTAAAYLSKSGHNVTVIEMKKENELGHNRYDECNFSVLADVLNIPETDFAEHQYRYKTDSSIISPDKNKIINIKYTDSDRPKIINHKYIIKLLIDNAKKNGVDFLFDTKIYGPVLMNNKIIGVLTSKGNATADLIIDSLGVFSVLRSSLPYEFDIEKEPKYGDLLFTYRACFEKSTDTVKSDCPSEYHFYNNNEPKIIRLCYNQNNIDIFFGRIFEFNEETVKKEIDGFRKETPVFTDKLKNDDEYAVIPLRRPLTLMVTNGYATVGDSAFMTDPLFGKGIDLSLKAGKLLADCVINACTDTYNADILWNYNRQYHILYGSKTVKNAIIKNAILSEPDEIINFLFESDIITCISNNKTIKISSVLKKFTNCIKKSEYFFTLIKGISNSKKISKLYIKAPETYNVEKIKKWNNKIKKFDIPIKK